MLANLVNFIKEARVELKKVNWPSKKQVMMYTAMVISMSVVVALFLGGLDFLFGSLLKKVIQ